MDNLAADALERLIRAYADLGIHRTGWPGDEATSAWLVDWLAARGVEAHAAPFGFPKLTSRAAFCETGGRRLDGVPLHDGGATGPGGLEAVLATPARLAEGGIALLESPSAADWSALLEPAASGARPAAAIAVTGDPQGQVMLRNAERMGAPFSLAVLQVAQAEAAPLREAAAAGARVRLVIDRDVRPARATNVLAEIPARGADGPVVLMTPKSGWFRCAAERGGGVAIALTLAARLAARPGRRPRIRVLFTGGHELGHLGLRELLAQEPVLREQARLWIHLGASIGARQVERMRLFSREAAWRAWFPGVLERRGVGPVELAAFETAPGGEAREVLERPFVSLAGHHAWFHSPRDLPEVAVDPQQVARYAQAFDELLERALG